MTEAQLKALEKRRGIKATPQTRNGAVFKAPSVSKPQATVDSDAFDTDPDDDILDEDDDTGGKVGPKAPRRKGRDRAAVIEYDYEPIEFRIDLPHNPRPKRRPRTVLNKKVIAAAVMKARGNVKAFFGALVDPVSGKSRATHTITPKVTVDYENLIRKHVVKELGNKPPFVGPVKLDLLFVLAGKPEEWPTSPADGDADNLEKAVADALNEVAFADDRFIVITRRAKVCRPTPGLFIRISAATPEDISFGGMIDTWDQLRE